MSFSLPSSSSLLKLPFMMMMMMMIDYDDGEIDVWHYKRTSACELFMTVFFLFFIRGQEKTKPKRNQNEAIQQTSKS